MATRKFTVPVTTAADGSATVYTPHFSGAVDVVQYVKTNFSDGVDFTITVDGTGETVWTEANVNSAAVKRPRSATHTTAGVAATLDGTVAALDRIYISRDRLKFVIASGGNATTGSFVVTAVD